MINRRGNLLNIAAHGLRSGGEHWDAVYAVSELRAASEPNPALPVVLQLPRVTPIPGEDWRRYKERVGERLADLAERLAKTAGVGARSLLFAANALAADLTLDQLDVIDRDPAVRLEVVEFDPLLDIAALDGLATDIGLPAVLAAHPTLDGSGVRVAVLDSGIDAAHPALSVSDAVSTCGESVAIPGAHGTHCAGILASRDPVLRGVAPGVELIDVKVMTAAGRGRSSWITRGIDEATDRDVDICSMSLGFNHLPPDSGGHGWDCPDGTCTLCVAVDNAVTTDGLIMVVAAGNDHDDAQKLVTAGRGHEYDTELSCPGQARQSICVGSHAKHTFAPAASSSNGPTAWGQLKPDLVAPGVQILSTAPVPRDANGSPVAGAPRSDLFRTKSGTSMATPAVAGACALVLQRARERGDPEDAATIRAALLASNVEPAGGPKHVVGGGRLRLQP